MHAGMEWMRRGRDRRVDPGRVLPGVRSIVVVALSYGGKPENGRDRDETAGIVARYALGDDYHDTMGGRLLGLESFIEELAPGHRAMAYVDHGPILERMWAARAGIGWVGKNSLVLNKEMGSWFFLGVVLTTLPLPPDAQVTDQCGACTLCIEACPTGAIVEPRTVDSRRCLSYHTIELRGVLPVEFRNAAGRRVFGCDDCQDVCPWNAEEVPRGTAFPPREGSSGPSLIELLRMTHEEYLERFRGSAIKRATWRGLRRNAALSLGNAAADEKTDRGVAEHALAALREVARDGADDPTVREQAAWSAERVARRLSS